jgi:transposase
VLEDLTHIRERIKAGKRVRSRLNRWPFRQLQEMIRYKSLLSGISVLTVDPRYTSQSCSGCHAIGQRHKHRFTCSNCGLRAHSDLNASRNLQGLGYLLIAQGLQ